MKVVNILTRTGYIKGVRGRSGGFTLAKRPEDINLADVVRATEPDFFLVDCFTPSNRCFITNSCRLPQVLNDELGSFIAPPDHYNRADLMLIQRDFTTPCAQSSEGRRSGKA